VARRTRRPAAPGRGGPEFRGGLDLGYLREVAPPAKILVVDDSRTQLDWLVKVLEREGYAVSTASGGREAIRKVKTEPPDLVLLDLILPDMDGLEVLRIMKPPAREDRPPAREDFFPVIILSVKADLDSKVAGLRIGADDFLAKPFAEAEILARCAAMLRIKHLQERLQEAQRKLEEQSITDGLTGLKNRRFFDERLQEEFKRAQRYGDSLSLIMIDLDHFKAVNDRHGHQAGDAVLREAAALMRQSIRDPDICARYGGEEFAVILPKTHMSGALAVAERIWRALGQKEYEVPVSAAAAEGKVKVTASVGLAFYPAKDISSGELLLRFADQALYQAKKAGRNTICLYQATAYHYDAGKR
jgi:two-component system cell cycle response regulator